MALIRLLLWDDWNEEHIARHGITRREVDEAVFDRPFMTRGRANTYRIIGQTAGGRYLTVYVAARGTGAYYVVTARDADMAERRAYRR